MNPSNSYSPEMVRLMLDQHSQAIERLCYFAAAILALWTLLVIYVIISNRLTGNRLKKIEQLTKEELETRLHWPLNENHGGGERFLSAGDLATKDFRKKQLKKLKKGKIYP